MALPHAALERFEPLGRVLLVAALPSLAAALPRRVRVSPPGLPEAAVVAEFRGPVFCPRHGALRRRRPGMPGFGAIAAVGQFRHHLRKVLAEGARKLRIRCAHRHVHLASSLHDPDFHVRTGPAVGTYAARHHDRQFPHRLCRRFGTRRRRLSRSGARRGAGRARGKSASASRLTARRRGPPAPRPTTGSRRRAAARVRPSVDRNPGPGRDTLSLAEPSLTRLMQSARPTLLSSPPSGPPPPAPWRSLRRLSVPFLVPAQPAESERPFPRASRPGLPLEHRPPKPWPEHRFRRSPPQAPRLPSRSGFRGKLRDAVVSRGRARCRRQPRRKGEFGLTRGRARFQFRTRRFARIYVRGGQCGRPAQAPQPLSRLAQPARRRLLLRRRLLRRRLLRCRPVRPGSESRPGRHRRQCC